MHSARVVSALRPFEAVIGIVALIVGVRNLLSVVAIAVGILTLLRILP